eukprot:9787790-Alexandrium_andersonii.AAC.1
MARSHHHPRPGPTRQRQRRQSPARPAPQATNPPSQPEGTARRGSAGAAPRPSPTRRPGRRA